MRFSRILSCVFLVSLFGLIVSVFAQQPDDGSAALDFIRQNPDDVAILCYTPGAEAQIEHNADEPFALASTYKLVYLAELASQTDAGIIDPSEAVPLTDVNAYWLPGTDGNAHQLFLDSLPEGQETVTLQDLADAMIRFSSNAAADYLLARLGTEGFPDLFSRIGLENTDLPTGTYLSLYLAFANHETGEVNMDTLDAAAVAAERQRLEALFLTDAGWRDAELDYQRGRAAQAQQAISEQGYEAWRATYERQAAFFSSDGTKGSARDMLRVMEAAYQGDTFAEAGKAVMQSALGWLFKANPANADVYDALGTKGGSWASIMTGVWYADPRQGEPLALAVFYRELPLELWADWSATFAHQMLEIKAITTGEGCAVFAEAIGG
jgi:D-alanyl-D-alanine carboxypeptidase